MYGINLLGISGSLRSGSLNTAVIRGLQNILPKGVSMRLMTLEALPLYNEELDTDQPPRAIAELRDSIAKADGLIICTPEYNYSIPGVLKNALDWASAPVDNSVLFHKPVVAMTASTAMTGGVRAQAHLSDVLMCVQALIVPGPQVVIADADDKVKDGQLVDKGTLKFARGVVDSLVFAIRLKRRLDKYNAARKGK